MKEVFSESVLKAACYNVAEQLGLFLSNWEMNGETKINSPCCSPTVSPQNQCVWKLFLPTSVHCPWYTRNALTILDSFSTSFSSSLWYLNLGCGRLLLKSSSLKMRSMSSCAEITQSDFAWISITGQIDQSFSQDYRVLWPRHGPGHQCRN